MKAHYKTKNGRIAFEVQGETAKDLFTSIASVQEVFEADTQCGLCKCEDLRFSVRHVDDYDFFELRCAKPGCFAKLSYGQAKKGGGLFPKRKDAGGNWLDNRGWEKYAKAGTTAAPARNGGEIPFITDEDVPF